MTTTMSLPQWEASTLSLVPGPSWRSFEDFRTKGAASLLQLPQNATAKFTVKNRRFVLLDEDLFQRVLGLANEVERSRNGLKVVFEAVQIAVAHPDAQHLNHVASSLSMIAQYSLLPVQHGHVPYGELPGDAPEKELEEDFDLESYIPERV